MLSMVPGFRTNFFNEFDNYFNRDRGLFQRENRDLMKTDIQKKDGLYLMKMDLPGFDKNDIEAELKDGYLTIRAQKDEKTENKDENGYVMRERYTGSCSRSFYVGKEISEGDIQAAFQNGILCLSFPADKPEKEDERKLIDIQ